MSLYTLKQEAEEIFEKFLTTMDETTGEVFDEELHLKPQAAPCRWSIQGFF